MGDRNAVPLYPGRETPTQRNRGQAQPSRPYDPNEDDPIEHNGSVRSNHAGEHVQYIVSPSIQVRPEFPSLTRTADLNQPMTCIVIIELPGKLAAGTAPGPVMSENYGTRNGNGHVKNEANHSGDSSPVPEQQTLQRRQQILSAPTEYSPPAYAQSATLSSPTSQRDHYSSFSAHPEPLQYVPEEESPFSGITEDLRNRIIDWKGHPLSDLGPLQMYDLLSVRRDSLVREFFVYLFKEAIICVVEEKKRSLGRLLSSASGFSDGGSLGNGTYSSQSKGVLRLKGRIYVRHIKQVKATSAAGEMSLTIDMEDELASFILIFKDRSSLESWKNQIQLQVNMFQAQNPHPQVQEAPLDMEEFGGSAKAARMLSGSTGTSASTVDSLLNDSSRSTMSSSTSHGSMAARFAQNKLYTLGEDEEMTEYESRTVLVTPHTSSGPSNSLNPVPHPPLDLILVISIPPASAVASTAALKLRVIKTSLDFTLASMGAKDRLSLVTFEVGVGGHVRKTPFLTIGKMPSRMRLIKFIDEIGNREEGFEDEFLVRASQEEKTDVVTAVNHGRCFFCLALIVRSIGQKRC